MTEIGFALLPGGRMGRLTRAITFATPITGYTCALGGATCPAALDLNGALTVEEGFTWDFGSYAIDTPAMVIASAAHDAFCLMTDRGLLPWKCRAMADAYFRELLKAHGVGFARRWWCWAGVRGYSKFVAYWKREK